MGRLILEKMVRRSPSRRRISETSKIVPRRATAGDIEALPAGLLDVAHFSVCEDHFHVWVEVHLLGAQVHYFLRLAEDGCYLVRGLAQGDGLRESGLGRLVGGLRWLGCSA